VVEIWNQQEENHKKILETIENDCTIISHAL
jgi:hypothetical protein